MFLQPPTLNLIPRERTSAMNISEFHYQLPEELIAQHPLPERDASRMLAVDRQAQTWRDSTFRSFPELLSETDLLVLNNTRVFAARLRGQRDPSGGAVELLLLRELRPNIWEALARPAKRLPIGSAINFGISELSAKVLDARTNGVRVIEFKSENDALDHVIDKIGEPPLPPYIKRDSSLTRQDSERYQTIYAHERGAIAAPTAGLHFTGAVLDAVRSRGVRVAEITLHVGYGTFEPVRVANVSQHQVLPEWFSIDDNAAAAINRAKAHGGRIIAVGTTTTRALESAVDDGGMIAPQSALANLTIVPGYNFRAVDALLTNFHLPQSSLLLLVAAFCGRDLILNAYRHAVRERYRFYSYGDCMFIS
jgi:S-adenosylmethionine:tRNA ribosyltransferase-isomerase